MLDITLQDFVIMAAIVRYAKTKQETVDILRDYFLCCQGLEIDDFNYNRLIEIIRSEQAA